jgi:hypothetical protein
MGMMSHNHEDRVGTGCGVMLGYLLNLMTQPKEKKYKAVQGHRLEWAARCLGQVQRVARGDT